MGYLFPLRRGLEQAIAAIHRVGGFTVNYTLARDTSIEGMNTIVFSGIAIQPTPLVRVREELGGRRTEAMSAAGNLSAEALPIFLVSRPVLFDPVLGVQHTPTFKDSFVSLNELGTLEVGTTFKIIQITEIAGVTPGWFITTVTQFRDSGRT